MNDKDSLAKVVWDYMLMHHTLKPMDAIFILGSEDLRVADRAAELFHQGFGKYVICSGLGGVAAVFDEPEAVVFGRRVEECGVPREKIILEPRATNTGENVQYTKALVAEMCLDVQSFILVQKPYMERRSYATFRKQWPEAECVVTSPELSYEEFMGDDEVFKTRHIQSMVGDLQRIKEYPAKGFQIEQDIPEEVWSAAQKLIELGYTKGVPS